MAQIETWYNQDLQQPVKVHYLDGSLFSHNSNGNRIGIHVFNNGEPVTLTGTVSGYVVTADGSTVPCTGTRSGNSASILIPAAAYQPGAVFITLFITDGTTVTTLASVSTSVLTARTNNQIDPGSVVTDWTQTINAAMQSVETAAENLGGIIAVPYANLTYPVPLGKYTYYEGNLYRCISPIATSESFTAAHWTQVRLGDDVSDLKSALSQDVYTTGLSFDEQIGLRKLFDPSYYESGRLNQQGNVYDDPDQHFTSDFLPVRGGQTINTTFAVTDYHHRIAEYDSNKSFVKITPYSSATSLTVATNSRYIRFCAPIAELNTAQVYTSDMLGPKLDNLKWYLDLENNVLGYSVLPTYNFAIYDPSNETEIGTEIGVTYTLPGDSFGVRMNLNPKESTRQRIYAVVAFSGAIVPSRVVGVNIFDTSGNALPTIERQVSVIHDNVNYTIIGIDLKDTDSYDMLSMIVSYGYSTTGREIKIEKAIVVNDLPVVPEQDVYIDCGSGKIFPTFTSVFNYCKGRPFIRYHVRWYGDGTPYDISLENGNTDPNGLHIPENVVEIVGAGDRDNNIIIDSYNNGTGAAFWIEYGVTIRNIYFKGTGKYCIHIDDPNNKRHDTVIENCRFYHATGGSGSIGVGFQAQYTLTIRNNWFERDTDAGIRVHNWDYGNQNNNHLIIEGNKFSANAMVHAIHLYTVSRNNYGFPIALICENEFNGLNIMLSEEDYQTFGVGNHWRVWGHNNSNVSVTITHHDDADYTNCVDIFMPTATVTDTRLQ